VVVTCVGLTILDAARVSVPIGYRSLPVHVAMDTASGWIALIAALLLHQRFRRDGRLADMLISVSLGIFAITSIGFAITAAQKAQAVYQSPVGIAQAWGMLGVLVLAVAALAPNVRVPERGRHALLYLALGALALTATALTAEALKHSLPSPFVDPHEAMGPFKPLGSSMAQLLSALLAWLSAVGFARRGGREGDELLKVIGGACIVLAFARLNYAIVPSVRWNWLYTGDVLRLGFYALVLGGAVREIARLQRETAETLAVHEERRRLARELHDVVAQDLVFIGNQARLTRAGLDIDRLGEIAGTADHALEGLRSAITALQHTGSTLHGGIKEAATEIAEREGIRLLEIRVPDIPVGRGVHDALVSIVREAMCNAARHGRAERVTVAVDRACPVRLTVRDDGSGFDVIKARSRRNGFGLTSMQERAEGIGASFRVSSGLAGTVVEVVLP
jgi:signal transduction histidine kinase